MEDEIKVRLRWVTLYLQTEDAGLVCRKCGVSRPTLRLWVRRYQKDGTEGLQSKPAGHRRLRIRELLKTSQCVTRRKNRQSSDARHKSRS
ncbi:MAG TPA: helix-turn-helix domain-containing protein [Blastocatellia bacterium]